MKATLAIVATLGSLLVGVPPASAAPPPAPSDAVPGPWEPRLHTQELVGPNGQRVTPFSGARPTEPKALPGFENTQGLAFRPAAGTDDIEDPEGPFICTTIITWSVGVREQFSPPPNPPPNTTQVAVVQYTAHLVCNFYFNFAFGVAGVADRSEGFDGRALHLGNQFNVVDGYQASSGGTAEIPGELYDGGRQIEVLFDITIAVPGTWGGCSPSPGQRVLRCDGVGTGVLRAILGTGVADSGLAPAVIRYVALGDSYSSGTGAPPYDRQNGTNCQRSSLSYPDRLRGMRAPITGRPAIDTPVFKACHGAVITDMYATQIMRGAESAQWSWLNRQATRLVTISIGGNDLGFAEVLGRCISENCVATGEPLISPIRAQMVQSELRSVYRNIRARIRPDGYIVVVGYPYFLPIPGTGEDMSCLHTFGISDAERDALLQAAQTIRSIVSSAAAAAGDSRLRFVDMHDAFAGHKVCEGEQAWSTGLALGERAYHPNERGYQVYRDRIAQVLGLLPA